MADLVQRYDVAVGRVAERRRTQLGGLVARANLTRVGVFEYRNPDGTIRRELRPPEEVFAPDSMATLSHATLTDDHPQKVTPQNWRKVSIGHVMGTPEQDGQFVASDIALQHDDAIDKAEGGSLVEVSCGYECEIDPTPGTWEGKPYDVVQRKIRYNHVALGPVGWGRAGPQVRMRLDSAGISGADWPDAPERADTDLDPEEWLGREVALAVADALDQIGGDVAGDEKKDSLRADDWDEGKHPRDERGRFSAGGGGGQHGAGSQTARSGTYAARVAAHQLFSSIDEDQTWERVGSGASAGAPHGAPAPRGAPNFALLHEPAKAAPATPVHPSHFGGVGGLLQHAASKIRGAAIAIGHAAVHEVKEKLHDFRHAALGIKAFLSGQEVTHEQKKAIKRAAVSIATYVLASHVAPMLPIHHLIHGEAAKKLVEQIAHHTMHHFSEKAGHRGLHLDAIDAADPIAAILAVFDRAMARDDAPTQAEREEIPDHLFGDPENKKYPLRNANEVKAASSYVEKEHNAGRISDEKYAEIRARVNKARAQHGIGAENQDSSFYVRPEMADTNLEQANADSLKRLTDRLDALETENKTLKTENATMKGELLVFRQTNDSQKEAQRQLEAQQRADGELEARLQAFDDARRFLGGNWSRSRQDGRLKSILDVQREIIDKLQPGLDLAKADASFVAGVYKAATMRADAAEHGRAAMQFATPFVGSLVREDARRRMGKAKGTPEVDPDEEAGAAGDDEVQDARDAMFQRQKDAYKMPPRRDRRRGFGAPMQDGGGNHTVPMRSAFGGGNQGDNAGQYGPGIG